jgi:hypothetical protein
MATAVICACLPALKPLLSSAMPNFFGSGTALGPPYSPGLSHPSAQQSKRSVLAADEAASISLRPHIQSDGDVQNDSDSSLVPMLKSSNAGERRWSSYDEDMESATMRPVGKDKMGMGIGMGMGSPVAVKALPPLLQERCSQWGWL